LAIHSESIKASIVLDATQGVDWYFNGLLAWCGGVAAGSAGKKDATGQRSGIEA
jgi:hypothetical protein